MGELVGSGSYTYLADDEGWGSIPSGFEFGDVGGVAVGPSDEVYVFNRGPHPMIVMDRSGEVIGSWGEGVFTRPHGLHLGPDGTLYCTDDGDHTVRRCTTDGKVLLEIGVPHSPAAFMSGKPFARCTHTALSPEGELYVSDGYSNAAVHKFSPEGRLLASFGRPGIGPGEFNLPHNICCDTDGWVYVADRENHRVQVFDGNGRFETMWHDLHRPSALFMSEGREHVFFVGEIGPVFDFNRGAPNLGPRVSVLDHHGGVICRIGKEPTAGTGAGQFISPHGIAMDSRGDLYIAEVSYTGWANLFGNPDRPVGLRALQKLVRQPTS